MRKRCILVIGAAIVGVSCSDDPALVLGGPAGPPEQLTLSVSKLNLTAAGDAPVIGAQPRDAVGNPASGTPQFASCDAAKVAVTAGEGTSLWAATATVRGNLLGESCVTVTSGNLVDTVRVFIAPGSILITGPAEVLSGQAAQFGLEFYAADGTQLTAGADFPVPQLVSLNPLRLPISAVDPITYDAAGQQPGNVTIRLMGHPEFGSLTASKTVTIVPGTFAGTLSATSGEPVFDTLVVRPPAARQDWDGDEYVTIGGVVASNWTGIVGQPQFPAAGDSLAFMLPVNLAPGRYQVVVIDQGPGQIAEVADSIDVVAPLLPYPQNLNAFPGTNTPGASLQNKRRPLSFPYLNSFTTSRSSYYTIQTGGTAFSFVATLSWLDATSDIDIEMIDGNFTVFLNPFPGPGRSFDIPEVLPWTTAANTFQFMRLTQYADQPVAAQMVIRVQ